MEEDEIDLLNKFINSVKTHYPELKFKIFLIYDNKHIPEVILKYNEYAYIVNSTMTTLDQNSKTNPISYYYLFNYLDKLNFPGAGLFDFISFRAALALITSLVISIIFGKRLINLLRRQQIGETVRDLRMIVIKVML